MGVSYFLFRNGDKNMARLPIYEGDFEIYDAQPTGAPIARCPNRASKIDARQLVSPVSGELALSNAVSPLRPAESLAACIQSDGGKQDFVPAGDLTEIPVEIHTH
jgi:hypothetical protein